MIPVTIIGMGMSPRDLSHEHWEEIQKAHIVIGGMRHLTDLKELACETRPVDKDLKALTAFIGEQMQRRRVVVLASGDPFYYGIGSYLAKVLGPENIRVLPNVSAVSTAFARLKMPWQDIPVVSLHGRDNLDLLTDKMGEHVILAVYTDPDHHPAMLARGLSKLGMNHWRMCVLERLGYEEERVQWFSLEQAAAGAFSEPNLVVLVREPDTVPSQRSLQLGTPTAWFARDSGPITKSEVRAVTLARLALAPDHILWDLGAGSGSVGIEASLLVTRGKIYAVEKNPGRISQIHANVSTFDVKNLEVVQAVLPGGLDQLPDPDRVFIGGGGADLEAILRAALDRLKPGGRVVINTVVIDQLQRAIATLEAGRMTVRVTHLQVSHSKPLGSGRYMTPLNPVWIIGAEKLA